MLRSELHTHSARALMAPRSAVQQRLVATAAAGRRVVFRNEGIGQARVESLDITTDLTYGVELELFFPSTVDVDRVRGAFQAAGLSNWRWVVSGTGTADLAAVQLNLGHHSPEALLHSSRGGSRDHLCSTLSRTCYKDRCQQDGSAAACQVRMLSTQAVVQCLLDVAAAEADLALIAATVEYIW